MVVLARQNLAEATNRLRQRHIDARTVDLTLGTVLKYQEDQNRVRASGVEELVRTALQRGA